MSIYKDASNEKSRWRGLKNMDEIVESEFEFRLAAGMPARGGLCWKQQAFIAPAGRRHGCASQRACP